MIIQIRSFANFRDILGRYLLVELKDGSSIRDLLDALTASRHRLKSALMMNPAKFESMSF